MSYDTWRGLSRTAWSSTVSPSWSIRAIFAPHWISLTTVLIWPWNMARWREEYPDSTSLLFIWPSLWSISHWSRDTFPVAAATWTRLRPDVSLLLPGLKQCLAHQSNALCGSAPVHNALVSSDVCLLDLHLTVQSALVVTVVMAMFEETIQRENIWNKKNNTLAISSELILFLLFTNIKYQLLL